MILEWFVPNPPLSLTWLAPDYETVISTGPNGEVYVASVIGPRGPAASGTRYIHEQSSAATTWIVNHNLGIRPAAVNVLTVGGIEMLADVIHTSDNQLQINFASPKAGRVVVA